MHCVHVYMLCIALKTCYVHSSYRPAIARSPICTRLHHHRQRLRINKLPPRQLPSSLVTPLLVTSRLPTSPHLTPPIFHHHHEAVPAARHPLSGPLRRQGPQASAQQGPAVRAAGLYPAGILIFPVLTTSAPKGKSQLRQPGPRACLQVCWLRSRPAGRSRCFAAGRPQCARRQLPQRPM